MLTALAKFDRASIHSGNKQWKAIPCDVAYISETSVLLPAYVEQACAVRSYDNTNSSGQKPLRTYKALVWNIPQKELLPVFFFFKKIKDVRASVQARGWPFLTFV